MNAFTKPTNLWALFSFYQMTKTVMAAEYAVLIFCMPKYNEIVDVPSCTALNLKSSKHGMESICMKM